jgi:hypothetical protein
MALGYGNMPQADKPSPKDPVTGVRIKIVHGTKMTSSLLHHLSEPPLSG